MEGEPLPVETNDTPVAPREFTSDREAAKSFESLFADDGSLVDLPATREEEAKIATEKGEQPGPQRLPNGQFAPGQKPAEEVETVAAEGEPTAPDDWADEHKEAFKNVPPEVRASWLAFDGKLRETAQAKEAEFAEKLKAAEAYPEHLKKLESTYQALAQITDAEGELKATIKREFADIKSAEDRLALSDPNSPKFDPTRAQRFEALIGMGREMMQAKAIAHDNREKALSAERQKDMAAQESKLYELVPDWGKLHKAGKSSEVRAALGEVREFLKSQGIPADQADALYNAHHLRVARDAMLYHKGLAEKAVQDKAAKAKIAAAPVVQKPGPGRSETAERQQLDASLKRLEKTGRVDDAAKVFERFV